MAKAAKKRAAKKKAVKKQTKKVALRKTVAAPGRKGSAEFTVKTGMEITAMFPDTTGLTAKVAEAVAAENVNILAATGY